MILSESEVNERLDSTSNLMIRLKSLSNRVEHRIIPQGGRTEGSVNIPPMVRELIGSLANEGNDTQSEIAEAFGVSQPTVSGSSRGLVGLRKEDGLREKVTETKINDAHDLALDAMVSSLTKLGGKMEEVEDPMKLAKIASEMSKITANIKPKDAPSATNVQVVLFAPNRMKRENEYESIPA